MNLNLAVLSHLQADANVTALCGPRLYAGSDEPPVDYTPLLGSAICFKLRNDGFLYEDFNSVGSVQFKCYGQTALAASQCYEKLKLSLHHQKSQHIQYGELESGGVNLREPETRWHFVLAFFSVLACA
jgi:hypothetical protein